MREYLAAYRDGETMGPDMQNALKNINHIVGFM